MHERTDGTGPPSTVSGHTSTMTTAGVQLSDIGLIDDLHGFQELEQLERGLSRRPELAEDVNHLLSLRLLPQKRIAENIKDLI